jgi:hypothetical protein
LISKNGVCHFNSIIAYLNGSRLEVAELNNILGHRDNEYVIHEPELSLKLAAKTKNKRAHGKKNRRPDAIYALRLTKNINFLLRDTLDTDLQGAFDVESPPVHRILDPSPYERPLDPMGDTLVFPFLILEAKSGKSADDWHSVQMQSALSARTFLQAQNALRIATGTRSRWNAGPLVWILANKGPDWRLSAAFVQDGLEKFNTIGTTDYVSK